MKKLLLAAAVIAALCLAAYTLTGRAERELPAADYSRTYIFRELDGVVACYEQGEEKPFLVTSVEVKNLTPKDRVLLAAGVDVHGARAMSRALEDYAS